MKRLRSNLECGVLKLEGVSTAKFVLFHQGSTELRRCENCVFLFPANILTGVARRLLGPHAVCLDKNEETKPILKSHISGTLEAISLKFGIWSTGVGGSVHSKNHLVSLRKRRATEVRKLHFRSSCQYTHGFFTPASWAARHTTVCIDSSYSSYQDSR